MKENKGISLSGFVIIILLILLASSVAGCVYLYKNPTKNEVIEQNFNTSIEENTIQNVVSTKVYSEKEVKEINDTIENYYKLLTAKENSPVLMLTDVMKLTVYGVQDPDYAPSNFVEHPNSSKYSWTGIKYKDFQNNLWYISENILKLNFPEFVEYKDYLYIEDNDINVYNFKYEIIKQEILAQSTQDTCICNVTIKNSKTEDIFINKIKLSRGNGDFVIVAVDKI